MYTVKIKQYKTGRRPFVVFFDDPKFKAITNGEWIATPFFGDYPKEKVIAEITRLNPEYKVEFEN